MQQRDPRCEPRLKQERMGHRSIGEVGEIGRDENAIEGRAHIASFHRVTARGGSANKSVAAAALGSGDATAGKTVFEQKCSACHAAAPFDEKKVGSGLAHLTDDPKHPKLVDDKEPTPANIAEILEKGFTGPIGVMPDRNANGLKDKEIADLVAYLVSLK